ncbi:MAG TPA: hypothetical protein VE082_03965, partial [Desulfobaccales bacterium]|nr:hypothetical protein [Desulfobaccales bacterium]
GYAHKFTPFKLSLTQPASSPPAAPPGPEEPEFSGRRLASPARPDVPFTTAEAERLENLIKRLVAENAQVETLRNPVDLERDTLVILSRDPASQLYPGVEEAARLAYQDTYTGIIDRAITEEILSQHYAPELKEIFAEDGLCALELMVQAAVAYYASSPVSESPDQDLIQQQAALEVERYLREDVYPRHRRPAGFYHDFYRAWVEPRIKQAIIREVAATTGQ